MSHLYPYPNPLCLNCVLLSGPLQHSEHGLVQIDAPADWEQRQIPSGVLPDKPAQVRQILGRSLDMHGFTVSCRPDTPRLLNSICHGPCTPWLNYGSSPERSHQMYLGRHASHPQLSRPAIHPTCQLHRGRARASQFQPSKSSWAHGPVRRAKSGVST